MRLPLGVRQAFCSNFNQWEIASDYAQDDIMVKILQAPSRQRRTSFAVQRVAELNQKNNQFGDIDISSDNLPAFVFDGVT